MSGRKLHSETSKTKQLVPVEFDLQPGMADFVPDKWSIPKTLDNIVF